MSEDRPKLPDRLQIDAITSVDELTALLAAVEAAKTKIEVDLEFNSAGTVEWERRARSALLAHRICEKCIRRHLARLTRKGAAPADVEAIQQQTKATNRLAQEQASLAAAARKQAQAETARTAAIVGVRKVLERGEYLFHFHRAALAMLGADECQRVHAEAQRLRGHAVSELLGESPTS